MPSDVPKSGFTILSGDRSVPVAADDLLRVLASVRGASEILKSLKHVASDKNILDDARRGGNGNGSMPPTEIAMRASALAEDALKALQGTVLDHQKLRLHKAAIGKCADRARHAFERQGEVYTTRPVSQASGHALTGALFAGLMDAEGALEHLVNIIDDIIARES